jgi:hypothetical protein
MEFRVDFSDAKSDDQITLEFTERTIQKGGDGCGMKGGNGCSMKGGDGCGMRGGGKNKNTDNSLVDDYEKDFYDIFNKAKEYRKRIVALQTNLHGGAREANPTILILGKIAKEVKQTNKYPEIKKWTDFIKIAKVILDKARANTNISDLSNDTLIKEFTRLAKDPKQLDAEIKTRLAEPPKNKKNAMSRPKNRYQYKLY